MLRWVRVRSLDLDEAFRADWLIATPSIIEMWGVVHKADGTFRSIFIQVYLDTLAVYKGIDGKLNLPWGHFGG